MADLFDDADSTGKLLAAGWTWIRQYGEVRWVEPDGSGAIVTEREALRRLKASEGKDGAE